MKLINGIKMYGGLSSSVFFSLCKYRLISYILVFSNPFALAKIVEKIFCSKTDCKFIICPKFFYAIDRSMVIYRIQGKLPDISRRNSKCINNTNAQWVPF